MRDVFFIAWQRFQRNETLDPMQKLIVEVAIKHPEYHGILENPEKNRDRDVFPEAGDNNPFLHMGLHLALIEQVNMNRPTGVTAAYNQLVARLQDPHAADHVAIDCLSEWLAQGPPHMESVFLDRLTELAGDKANSAD